jgi:threonylcarbamoyladenosine tRNA methylthiotransferase MtaB
MRVRLETLGCRLNTAECERLAREFDAAGHHVVDDGQPFDVCIVNTCAVTGVAGRKSRQLIRHLQHTQPDAFFVVTGCYAELEPQQSAALGVAMVVGNHDKDAIVNLVTARLDRPTTAGTAQVTGAVKGTPGQRTRAFIKVQDGCDNACTFCVVRLARGTGRSRPIAEVLAEVRRLVELGYREVVLSGVHLGAYGHDWGDRRGLFGLVQRLLDETDVARLRLSSLEPWDLDVGAFDLWQERRLAPSLHLPLQSGCAATLRRMARRTTPDEYAALVAAARASIPDLAVTTDVMVGFPGETEAEFNASLAFVEAQGFAHLHIFRYSPRPGTPAARLPDQVPAAVAALRSRQLHVLGREHARAFRRRFVGRTMNVLWESGTPEAGGRRWSGLSENGLRVVTQVGPGSDGGDGPGLRNVITPTRLVSEDDDGLRGEIVETWPCQ